MQRGSEEIEPVAEDYQFSQTQIFDQPGFPHMFFIEKKYSGDPTNWWIPNRACTEALLRSAGFEILNHPEQEVFICRWKLLAGGETNTAYPARTSAPG
jgi:tRNA (mo5U34)-methyltransferase